jgi:hypothetical protein
MHALRAVWGICLLLMPVIASADTIAITEFMNQPIGEANGRQWVELFNYGPEPVTLKGWQILDERSQIADVPEMTLPSGGYAIVVLGHNRLPGRDKKALFEKEWLGGKENDLVWGIANANFVLHGTGELILRNPKRKPVWQLAYKNDGKPGHATFLAQNEFFPNRYGNKAAPGINRAGNEYSVTNIIGYESNFATKDPLAYESDVSGLEDEFGILYKTKAKDGDVMPGVGSPLKGEYTVKKK